MATNHNHGDVGKRKKRWIEEVDQPQQQQQPQQPQILRVRRRRGDTESAANALRIAPPHQLDTLLANWTVNEHDEKPFASSSSFVYYERVAAPTTDRKRRKHDILDAHLLEQDDTDAAAAAADPRSNKRRKLQMVVVQNGPTMKSNRVVVEYPTLTPAQNRVNESLLMVFQGDRSLAEHLVFLQNTFHCDDDGHDDDDSSSWKVWLHWCCSNGGTILHAAALWDHQSTALLQLLQQQQEQQEADNNTVLQLSELLHVLDEEGRSALDIARLSCNEEMIVVLERLESQSDYVYDFYEYRPEPIDTTTTNTMNDDDDDPQQQLSILDCELLRHNAVYKAGAVLDSDLLDVRGNHNDADDDDEEDEDEDSNNEDFFANDYPDEESSSGGGNFWDNDDGEFDPAYGGVYDQQY